MQNRGMFKSKSESKSDPKPRSESESRSESVVQLPCLSLDELADQCPARIRRVDPAAAGQPADRAAQLADIGFTAGETVTVLARAWPGGDPLVVRVGAARFALRRAEAACIRVQEIQALQEQA